ncbi:hypothetical protein ACOMHN_051052 [Nucella lapillus]
MAVAVSVWSGPSLHRVVSAVHALCMVSVVLGEPFYQRRDHLDQARYLTLHNDNVVKDRGDAEPTPSTYPFNLPLQPTPSTYPFNLPLQPTPSTYPFNLPL